MLTTTFSEKFKLELPLIQAPMAGVATPELAAAVCHAGAIGSLGLGASTAENASKSIKALKTLTSRPFNTNFFCHQPTVLSQNDMQNWLMKLVPLFREFRSDGPRDLHEIYKSFYDNDGLLRVVLEEKPAIASFHFGLPTKAAITAMQQAGIYLIASATCLEEAVAIQQAGFDAVIAQGYEAGGHRGIFDENGSDERLTLIPLLKLLTKNLSIPVIAAGGIMDGHGMRKVIEMGAAAAQLGTAFIGCPESQADIGYRQTLSSLSADHTVMTRAFSGRPARALTNKFTEFTSDIGDADVAPYPYAYDAAKQLHAIAVQNSDYGYGAYWAGEGAPFARPMSAASLVKCLKEEYRAEQCV